MSNPFETPEGNPSPGSSQVPENLWSSAYLNATGQLPADSSTTLSTAPGATTDLSQLAAGTAGGPTTGGAAGGMLQQALETLQSGDEKDGILGLMQAAQQNPQLLQDATFVQTLRVMENEPSPDGNVFDAYPYPPTSTGGQTAPADASSTPGLPGAQGSPSSGDASLQGAGSNLVDPSVYTQGLNFLQVGDKVDGMLYLMQAAVNNPQILQDNTFLQSFQGVEAQAASGSQAATTPGADATAGQAASGGGQTGASSTTPLDTSGSTTGGSTTGGTAGDPFAGADAQLSQFDTDAQSLVQGGQLSAQALQAFETQAMNYLGSGQATDNQALTQALSDLTSGQNGAQQLSSQDAAALQALIQQDVPASATGTASTSAGLAPGTDASGNPVQPGTGGQVPQGVLSDLTQGLSLWQQGDRASGMEYLLQTMSMDPQLLSDPNFVTLMQNMDQGTAAGTTAPGSPGAIGVSSTAQGGVDQVSGLPVDQTSGVLIDPTTGQPFGPIGGQAGSTATDQTAPGATGQTTGQPTDQTGGTSGPAPAASDPVLNQVATDLQNAVSNNTVSQAGAQQFVSAVDSLLQSANPPADDATLLNQALQQAQQSGLSASDASALQNIITNDTQAAGSASTSMGTAGAAPQAGLPVTAPGGGSTGG